MRICLLLITILLLINCSKNEPNYVAKVGESYILASEFKENYAFGFGHLKKKEQPRKHYLELMVNERLLALEGYEKGLEQKPFVTMQEARLMEELLVEAWLDRHVKQHIQVSKHEMEQAARKSFVSFKMRYWMERNRHTAQEVSHEMNRRGYADVLADLLKNSDTPNLNPKQFETGYLTWQEIPNNVHNALENLEIGAISAPVEMENGHFAIFQILDIQRAAFSQMQVAAKMPTMRQILYSAKLREQTSQKVAKIMEKQQVRTKAQALQSIANALVEWKRDPLQSKAFLEAVKRTEVETSTLYKLKKIYEMPLSIFNEGTILVKDFVKTLNPNGWETNIEISDHFLNFLNEHLAQYIRNRILIKKAQQEGLQNHDIVQKELAKWRNKWVYQQNRSDIIKQEDGNSAKSEGLKKHLESLRKKYNVTYNYPLLDSLKIEEHKNNKGATVQIYKQGSGRMLIPVVDGSWQ